MTTIRIHQGSVLAALLLCGACVSTTGGWGPAAPATPDRPRGPSYDDCLCEDCDCGPCAHATLGIETVDASRALRRRHGLPDEVRGAMVVEVLPDGPAARAGIARGDVIERIDDTEVRGFAPSTLTPGGCGGRKRLAVRRGEERLSVEVVPADAARVFADACAHGSATGCFYLGWLTYHGEGIATDTERGKRLIAAACGDGSGKACRELAQMAEQQRPPEPDLAQQRVRLRERACELHLASACVDLGAGYANGLYGMPRDDDRAVTLFAGACDDGEPNGCANLGFMYRDGRGLPLDYRAAFELFEDACAGGSSQACLGLACLHEKGLGVPASAEKAAALFDRLCTGEQPGEEPNLTACLNLGQMLRDGRGVKANPDRAIKIFTDLCDRAKEAGDTCAFPCPTRDLAHGCSLLGAMLAFGIGVERDPHRAIELSRQGCARGDAFGCFNLGVWYDARDGLEADDAKSLAYFRRACDGGNAAACFQVGLAFYEGRGAERSELLSAMWYQQACDGGEARACSNLGASYEDGTGVAMDEAKGLALFQRACDIGEAVGCFNLANRYADGDHVEQDLARAAKLYQLACSRQYQPACQELAGLKQKLAPRR